MSKQYTFKTTKSTLWLENVLDSMGSRERSEFIRSAIIHHLADTSSTQVDRRVLTSDKRSDKMKDKDFEIQRFDNFKTSGVSDKEKDLQSDFDIIEEDTDSLDDKLDNITF